MPYSVPLVIAQNISPSVLALCQSASVKFLGRGLKEAPAAPSPLPSVPWQVKHTPLPAKISFASERVFASAVTMFTRPFTSASLSAGTLDFNTSSSAEYAGFVSKDIKVIKVRHRDITRVAGSNRSVFHVFIISPPFKSLF